MALTDTQHVASKKTNKILIEEFIVDGYCAVEREYTCANKAKNVTLSTLAGKQCNNLTRTFTPDNEYE